MIFAFNKFIVDIAANLPKKAEDFRMQTKTFIYLHHLLQHNAVFGVKMKGLSEKEMEIVSFLEFEKKYFFTREDIASFFSSYNQTRHTLHKLIQKGRIINLNRNKYYLIPIKAKSGKWVENSFTLVDEVMNGRDYFIGGWASANYWGLTEQVPMKIEVFTTKRNGIKKYLATTIIFKRTTKARIKKALTKEINAHSFRILGEEESKKWLKSRA